MGFSSCCGNGHQAESALLRYHFASQEEGQKLRLDNPAYFDALTQNDIDWKLMSAGQSMEAYKSIAAAQIEEFSDAEKKALSKVLDFIEARMQELGFRLPIADEIVFIKSRMGDEGLMGGYTFKNQVYLSADETEFMVRTFQADPAYDADYLEYALHFSRALVAHEIFHCLTRNNPQFRQAVYNLIGFTVMDHEVEFGPTVKEVLLHNPDEERFDSYAEFTIGGQKRRCALVGVYPGPYAQVAAQDPNAHFFDYMHLVLVPLDEPDTMIPIEEAPDFYDRMGRNADYIYTAEEYLAENFCFLVAYGFFGRYDHGIVDRKIHFIPYDNPQLIRGIHSTLLEFSSR